MYVYLVQLETLGGLDVYVYVHVYVYLVQLETLGGLDVAARLVCAPRDHRPVLLEG